MLLYFAIAKFYLCNSVVHVSVIEISISTFHCKLKYSVAICAVVRFQTWDSSLTSVITYKIFAYSNNCIVLNYPTCKGKIVLVMFQV
jgi:hypothetical protein